MDAHDQAAQLTMTRLHFLKFKITFFLTRALEKCRFAATPATVGWMSAEDSHPRWMLESGLLVDATDGEPELAALFNAYSASPGNETK